MHRHARGHTLRCLDRPEVAEPLQALQRRMQATTQECTAESSAAANANPWQRFDRSIDIRIGRLRRKVEPEPGGEPRCIRTVSNAGHMYVPALCPPPLRSAPACPAR